MMFEIITVAKKQIYTYFNVNKPYLFKCQLYCFILPMVKIIHQVKNGLK